MWTWVWQSLWAVDSYLLIRLTTVLIKWCHWTQPSFRSIMFTSSQLISISVSSHLCLRPPSSSSLAALLPQFCMLFFFTMCFMLLPISLYSNLKLHIVYILHSSDTSSVVSPNFFVSSLFQRQLQYPFFIESDREPHLGWVFKTTDLLSNCFHPPWLHKTAVIIPRYPETNVFRMASRPFIGITFTVTLQLFLTDVCRKCHSLVMSACYQQAAIRLLCSNVVLSENLL